MSRLWARFAALFSSRTFSGMDKSGNRYHARYKEIDGVIEWICWLNGQRKRAPTPEEMAELEARRERVKLSVALLKQEEEERKAKEGKATTIGKAAGPDLKSFIRQFPSDSEGNKIEEASDSVNVTSGPKESQTEKDAPSYNRKEPQSSEPTGTGESFRPGTWQP